MSKAAELAKFIGFSGSSAGKVLQVQYTQFASTNTVSLTLGTAAIFTDLTVDITPTSSSSIIKIEAGIMGEFANSGNIYNSMWLFYRDSTALGHAGAGNRNVGIAPTALTVESADDNSTPEWTHYHYFDSPATTSQITYKVACRANVAASDTFYLNSTVADTDNSAYERGVSYISVTEIAG